MSSAGDDSGLAAGFAVPYTVGVAEPSEAPLDRVLTIPNLLSIGRLALFGWFLQSLFGTDARLDQVITVHGRGNSNCFPASLHELQKSHLSCCILHGNTVWTKIDIR